MSENSAPIVFYPFAYGLLDDELGNYCWYCMKQPNNSDPLKRCTKCKTALFCGKECQTLGWIDHKAECKSLEKWTGKPPDIEVRLLGRIVQRYKAIKEGKDDPKDAFYLNRQSSRSIMEIWSHTDEMRADPVAWKKFERIYIDLCAFYGMKSLMDENTVFELHCRNYINRHAISDMDYMKEIGKGLYLDLCAYDHSCRPNAIYTCNGFVATLKSLIPGHNLSVIPSTFYSYIDLLQCKQQRQKLLRDSWYFECACERCIDQSEQILTALKCEFCSSPVLLFGPEAKAKSCRQNGHPCPQDRIKLGLQCMREIDELLESGKLAGNLLMSLGLKTKFTSFLHSSNVYFIKILRSVIENSKPDDTELLLEVHLGALPCMRICYPRNHPALAFHLMNIGAFFVRLEKFEDAKIYLFESYEMLNLVLGIDHSMTKQCSDLLQRCS